MLYEIVVFAVPSWLLLLDRTRREKPKTCPERRGVYGLHGFTSGFE